MKTHYDPYAVEYDEPPEKMLCGSILAEDGEFTGDWRKVTCRRCLNQRSRLEDLVAQTERDIANQMGDMADFMNKEQPNDLNFYRVG